MKTLAKIVTIFGIFMMSGFCQADEITALVGKIETSVKAKSSKDFLELLFKNGAPKEIKDGLTPFIEKMFTNESLKAINAHAVADYKPKMELPGKIEDKALAYTTKPTHWVVVSFATEGVELVIPAAKIDDTWQIVGTDFAK